MPETIVAAVVILVGGLALAVAGSRFGMLVTGVLATHLDREDAADEAEDPSGGSAH